MNPSPKTCRSCGRTIEWRKKWARDWDQVKYCSDRCRARKGTDDAGYEAKILEILSTRAGGATMCPSEVLPIADRHDAGLMEDVRRAARRLVEAGRIEITQKGRVVDPSAFKGPIRLRLRTPSI